MTVGLRIRDDAGNMVVDEFTSLATNVAIVTVGKTNGSYTLPAEVAGKASYIIFTVGFSSYAPEFTFSNDERTIIWTWPQSGANYNAIFQMYVGSV
jgi:hypothetical protein